LIKNLLKSNMKIYIKSNMKSFDNVMSQ